MVTIESQFNIQQLYLLPTQCTYLFCVNLKRNSDYFLYKTNWLTFITQIKHSKASGHCMYNQINIQQFYILPTLCRYEFCVALRKNSDYFLIEFLDF